MRVPLQVGDKVVVTFEQANDGKGTVAHTQGNLIFPSRRDWSPLPRVGEMWKVTIVFQSPAPQEHIYRCSPVCRQPNSAPRRRNASMERTTRREREPRMRMRDPAPPDLPFAVHFVAGRLETTAYWGGDICRPSPLWENKAQLPADGEVYMVEVEHRTRAQGDTPGEWYVVPVAYVGRWPAMPVIFESAEAAGPLRPVRFLRPRDIDHPHSVVANISGRPAYPDDRYWNFPVEPDELWLVRIVSWSETEVVIAPGARFFDEAVLSRFGSVDSFYPG